MQVGKAISLLLSGAVAASLAVVGVAGASTTPQAVAAESDQVYEVRYVPTVGNAVIRVEIWRDASYDARKQPVILTYSPYNSLSEPETARDSVGETFVPKGYARAVADVLGTRGSTGCWDYGGPREQQSGVDVVKWLADRTWSNGKVAMIGGSYNGTTASMVAARGADVPELKAIVPIAGISRWYGYAYGNGVRYFLNSKVPSDEGFDTPLGFDFGFAKTVAADPMGQTFADTIRDKAAECGAVEHTEEGYNRNPDYDRFWLQRDYRKDARDFRAAVLLAHGWQDYNVKQEEGTELFRRIPVDRPATRAVEGVPFKIMHLTQGSHSGATNSRRWNGLLERFFARTLKGTRTGIANEGPVITQGRTSAGAGAVHDGSRLPAAEHSQHATVAAGRRPACQPPGPLRSGCVVRRDRYVGRGGPAGQRAQLPVRTRRAGHPAGRFRGLQCEGPGLERDDAPDAGAGRHRPRRHHEHDRAWFPAPRLPQRPGR